LVGGRLRRRRKGLRRPVAFSAAKAVVAGGVGVRYLLARKLGLHVGLDLARGPEDTVVYLQVGSAWFSDHLGRARSLTVGSGARRQTRETGIPPGRSSATSVERSLSRQQMTIEATIRLPLSKLSPASFKAACPVPAPINCDQER
jgi:hypothetical protein